jgi:hypothetical protein
MAIAFAGPLCQFLAQSPGDAARLQPGTALWQQDLLAALGDKPRLPQPWGEDAAADALQQDLGDAGLLALRLFALYAERPELELPDTAPALLELDRSWRTAADSGFDRSLYAQILAPRLWLPGDFPFTFKAPMPDGDAAEFGSVDNLLEQLRWLNQRTFQGDVEVVAQWRQLQAPAGGDLLDAARRGLGGLLEVGAFAAGHRLPLIVREW